MGARTALNNTIQKADQFLRAEFGSLSFARTTFPMLTTWGVADFSLTIHSLGCNYLAAMGREAGFWAMSEYPVRVASASARNSVVPDVAWWEKSTGDAILLGEFERTEPRRPVKLVEKAKNLLQAHQSLGERPRLLLLVGWALAGTDLGDLGKVRAIMASGFRTADGTPVQGLEQESKFLLATAVFGDVDGGRKLLQVLV
jgi:hypothetical protein